MTLTARLDALHNYIRSNKWFSYFTIFNRIALAAGFIPSGLTKILGERFTSLSVKHPMGNYLEALYHTGYYYPFIGYVQVLAAILLLIPRTATLGAVLYFPLILNICILSLSVGFDGSLVTSPLMVLANLYLLCWDYDKLKFILPFYKPDTYSGKQQTLKTSGNKFPLKFFTTVLLTITLTILVVTSAYHKKTRNTPEDCISDCKTDDNTQECYDFCDCIHQQGKPFNECAARLREAKEKRN